MDARKKARLEKAGWKVGTVQELLGLSDEEATMIEMKVSLARSLKKQRLASGVTQAQLARKLGSSQSRIAKMEAADPSVSLDLLVRGLLALGKTGKEVGMMIATPTKKPAA